MSIDWITVAAQIANFLVLVWLLKRFLYRPILNGIDAREAEIAQRMQDATQAKEEATAVQAEYHEKLRRLHVEQSEMSETIRKEAEQKRDALLADVHSRMARENAALQAHQEEEARRYTARLQRSGGAALLSLTRKALGDLADETLEARMAHRFLVQIRSAAKELKRAAGDATTATVLSREPLPPSVQDSIKRELETVFPQVDTEFETDATQSTGLVLRIGGAELAWTVDTYFDGLEDVMAAQLAKGASYDE